MRARRIETVFQWVTDVEAASRWYAGFLQVDPEPYEAPWFPLDGGAYLLLGEAGPGTGRGGTGIWFEVEDVDAAYAERVSAGYAFNEEPFDIPPGRLVTINDLDGNIIGLIDNSEGGMPRRSSETKDQRPE